MKKIFLFSVALIILFNSCKKDVLNTTVSGVVSNKKTGQLLANIKVELLELKVYKLEIMGGPSPSDTLDRFISNTDISGKYFLEYKSSKSRKVNKGALIEPPVLEYSVLINQNNYYKSFKKIYNASTKTKTFVANIELVPHTFIKYKYKNISPFNDDDLLYLMNGEEIVGKIVNGTTSSILCNLIAGNSDLSNYKISWSVKKNGLINNFEKTINCAIGDTTLIEINY